MIFFFIIINITKSYYILNHNTLTKNNKNTTLNLLNVEL